MARNDGLFVFEMVIDQNGGLDPDDVDELAHVASMVLKGKLKHTHYHHNMPGKGSANRLRPSEILAVWPIRMDPAGWSAALASGDLSQSILRAAKCAVCPAGTSPRQALVALRFAYLQLEDAIAFRIKMHRRRQAVAPLIRFAAAMVYGLIAALVIMLPIASNLMRSDIWDWLGLAMAVAALAFALHFRQRISRWDIPVIRLLRTAHGFFVSANVLNRVISEVQLDGRTVRPVDGFSDVIENLHSRLEGEQHRVQIGQGWLALAVAAASLMAALAALQTQAPDQRSVQQPDFQLIREQTRTSTTITMEIRRI